MSRTAIRAAGVRKEYGADDVVDDVDLSVRENEILLLLGPNGVGKTVLLSCLAGSERPTAGEIEVFGTPVAEDGGDQYGFLLQDTMAVDTLTGRENAAFYARLHPAFTDRWERYVETLGLDGDLDKSVEHYSGGMRRKLEVALTMSLDVPVYLLDEPTAGVDLTAIQRIHDVILERQDAGATMVIASHRPMDVDLADRLAIIPGGTVSTVGTPEALAAKVPSVVRVTGPEAIETVEPDLVDSRLFPVGGEARGFLAPEVPVEDLGEPDDGNVQVARPTHADLFNYYVHVEP